MTDDTLLPLCTAASSLILALDIHLDRARRSFGELLSKIREFSKRGVFGRQLLIVERTRSDTYAQSKI